MDNCKLLTQHFTQLSIINYQFTICLMNDTDFNKLLISINAILPLAIFTFDFSSGNVGTNPIEFFLRTSGVLCLIALLVTLSVTPLRKIFGWNGLIKYRRMLGLYAFFYGVLHLVTYSIFDKSGNVIDITKDVFERPFIAVGMFALLLMIPLAVTSTNAMIKKLGGKNWAKLHKLTYVIAFGGVLHFYMIVKSDIFYPAIFAIVLAILLGYRFFTNKPKVQNVKAES
jgi:methionine sulfoxide reductase heme-binding subunit